MFTRRREELSFLFNFGERKKNRKRHENKKKKKEFGSGMHVIKT